MRKPQIKSSIKFFWPKNKLCKRLLRSLKKKIFRFFRNSSATSFSGFFRGTKTRPLNEEFPLNVVSLNAVGTVIELQINDFFAIQFQPYFNSSPSFKLLKYPIHKRFKILEFWDNLPLKSEIQKLEIQLVRKIVVSRLIHYEIFGGLRVERRGLGGVRTLTT